MKHMAVAWVLLVTSVAAALMAHGDAWSAPAGPQAPTSPILFDDFSNARSGWSVGRDEVASSEYVDGEYHLSLKLPNYLTSASTPSHGAMTDFGMQVEMHVAESDTRAAAGLFFAGSRPGASPNVRTHFVVWPAQGQFAVYQERDGQNSPVVNWTPSSAIRGGSVRNVLRVERRASQVRLMVNGSFLTAVDVPADAPEVTGLVALHTGGAGSADAYFDNFLLETLDEGAATPTRAATTGGPTATGTQRTPTPTARNTATPRITTTPVATPLPIATPFDSPYSEVVMDDDFSDPSTGWRIFRDPTYTAEYLNGEYHMFKRTPSSNWGFYHQVEVGAFDLQVDVRMERADPGDGIGIWFGAGDQGDDVDISYFAYIRPQDGVAGLEEFTDRQRVLIPPTVTGALRPGTATNRLRLISDGQRVTFYANGVALFSPVLSPSMGHIGLVLGNGADAEGAGAYFDNLRITVPPGSAPTPPPMPKYGQVKWDDDFSDATSGWPIDHSDTNAREYLNGEYHIAALRQKSIYGSFRGAGGTIFDLSADVRAAGDGANVIYGLFFDLLESGEGYGFLIDPVAGTFRLDRAPARASGGSYRAVIPSSESPAIRRGGATNRLRVVSGESYFMVLVNDVRLYYIRMPLGSSGVGLVTAAGNSPQGAHAYFDNLRLLTPGEAASKTATPRPTAADPNLLYYEDFSDPASQWPNQTNQGYRNGEYFVAMAGTIHAHQAIAGLPAGRDLATFDLGLTTRLDLADARPGHHYSGLVFGSSFDDTMGFMFVVDPARREYSLLRNFNGRIDAIPVVGWTASRAIMPTGSRNRLRVARGPDDVALLYVNDTLLTSVPWPYPLGDFGMFAGEDGPIQDFVAWFDDLELRRYGSAPPARGGARTPTPLHAGTAVPPAMLTVTAAAADRSRRAYLPLAMRVGTNGR